MNTLKLGKRIKEIRKEFGLTQEAFGNKVGVDRDTVVRYEKGKVKPGFLILQNIVSLWPVNAFWLLTGEAEMLWRGSRAPSPKESAVEERIEEVMQGKKISDLIYMATEVLESGDEEYSDALEKNIKAFFKASRGGLTEKLEVGQLPLGRSKKGGH